LGIDLHGLNFTRYAARKKPLAKVATIGRQSLAIPSLQAQYGPFCELYLMGQLGATSVDSYDTSPYEGASHLADLNKPITSPAQYDTIIDFGTTEHIYNVAQVFENISLLCACGGQILHVSPANNFCGHGFFQFSPELYFSLYSEENGYRETEVFLADLDNTRHWFSVTRPQLGERAQSTSKSPLYVLCRTVMHNRNLRHEVQQSDYIHSWATTPPESQAQSSLFRTAKKLVKSSPTMYAAALWLLRHRRAKQDRIGLSGKNRHFKKVPVATLLKDQKHPAP